MAKIKRVSVNAFEKAMKETYIPTEVFTWNGIEVTVKKNLSLKEMLEFVDSVVKSCFTKDTNTYIPEIMDFTIKVCVLEKYANFTMPNNVTTQYELVYHTDAVDCVLKYINLRQFNEVCVAINKKIENLAQANIEAVNKQMNELYNAFDNLQNKLASLFEGINSEDVRAVAGALANGMLDEEKLVKAYTSQTMNNSGEQ